MAKAAWDLADYERVLLDQVLAIPAVTQARSAFAIRTVPSRGPGAAHPLALTAGLVSARHRRGKTVVLYVRSGAK